MKTKPTRPGAHLGIRVPMELKSRIELAAKNHGVYVSSLVIEAIERFLRDLKK